MPAAFGVITGHWSPIDKLVYDLGRFVNSEMLQTAKMKMELIQFVTSVIAVQSIAVYYSAR